MIDFIDLWGGSYYVEKLIGELVDEVWKFIMEVEELGGMVKVIEIGILKMCIEEVVVWKQVWIDFGKDVIVGVNCYQIEEIFDIDILDVDNVKVCQV